MAAVDVVTEIKITRPRDEVSAFAADPSNATAWYKNIKAVEWDTPAPVVVDSRVRFRAQFLGRTLEYTYEVEELELGRRFVIATAQGPFPHADDVHLGGRGGRCDQDDSPQSGGALGFRCSHGACHDSSDAQGQRGRSSAIEGAPGTPTRGKDLERTRRQIQTPIHPGALTASTRRTAIPTMRGVPAVRAACSYS